MGVVEDLFYQYIRKLEEWGATDHETVFIDGTKLESRAGRYTFVWKKSVEKYLEKVREDVFAATGIRTLPSIIPMVNTICENLLLSKSVPERRCQFRIEQDRLPSVFLEYTDIKSQAISAM